MKDIQELPGSEDLINQFLVSKTLSEKMDLDQEEEDKDFVTKEWETYSKESQLEQSFDAATFLNHVRK